MKKERPTSVMIVDDHQIFLDGLKLLLDLQEGVEVKYMATSAREALARLQLKDIDVVVTDINMPGMDGIGLIGEGKEKYDDVKFIALTMLSDQTTIRNSLDAGAHGYLLKNSSGHELSEAINLVMSNSVYISPEINALLSQSNRLNSQEPELTAREAEVLEWIVRGMSSKQIAQELDLSIDTIKYHRKNILSKLNQPNSAALVSYALLHGIVKVND